MTDESRARAWREKNGSLYIVNSNQRTWHDSDAASYARSEVIRELEQLTKDFCYRCEKGDAVDFLFQRWRHGTAICRAPGIQVRIAELRAQEEKPWCLVCDRSKSDCACVDNGGTY